MDLGGFRAPDYEGDMRKAADRAGQQGRARQIATAVATGLIQARGIGDVTEALDLYDEVYQEALRREAT